MRESKEIYIKFAEQKLIKKVMKMLLIFDNQMYKKKIGKS